MLPRANAPCEDRSHKTGWSSLRPPAVSGLSAPFRISMRPVTDCLWLRCSGSHLFEGAPCRRTSCVKRSRRPTSNTNRWTEFPAESRRSGSRLEYRQVLLRRRAVSRYCSKWRRIWHDHQALPRRTANQGSGPRTHVRIRHLQQIDQGLFRVGGQHVAGAPTGIAQHVVASRICSNSRGRGRAETFTLRR